MTSTTPICTDEAKIRAHARRDTLTSPLRGAAATHAWRTVAAD
jgi:hypothetical protein